MGLAVYWAGQFILDIVFVLDGKRTVRKYTFWSTVRVRGYLLSVWASILLQLEINVEE